MKTIKFLIAILVLLICTMVGYRIGKGQYEKCYEDACHMSDLIRCYEDHLNEEGSDIEDYGCFEELQGNFLYDDSTGSPVHLEDYAWCY